MSKMTGSWPSASSETHDVFPPYRSYWSPAHGVDPRTPWNESLIPPRTLGGYRLKGREAREREINDRERHVIGGGEGAAEALAHVDERVDEHQPLQPGESPDLDRPQCGPGVVDATEEGERDHDDAEHHRDRPGLEPGPEGEPERGGRDACERHQREHHGPVELEVHVVGGHDRRDRKDEERGDETLDRARGHLARRDERHREWREHSILDLLRVAELLHHRQGDRLDALEEDRDADDAGDEERRERRLRRRPGATADALPDLREHVREHEHEQERLEQRPGEELVELLAQHGEVAQEERLERDPAGGGGVAA